jgi:hypothetical protein
MKAFAKNAPIAGALQTLFLLSAALAVLVVAGGCATVAPHTPPITDTEGNAIHKLD